MHNALHWGGKCEGQLVVWHLFRKKVLPSSILYTWSFHFFHLRQYFLFNFLLEWMVCFWGTLFLFVALLGGLFFLHCVCVGHVNYGQKFSLEASAWIYLNEGPRHCSVRMPLWKAHCWNFGTGKNVLVQPWKWLQKWWYGTMYLCFLYSSSDRLSYQPGKKKKESFPNARSTKST